MYQHENQPNNPKHMKQLKTKRRKVDGTRPSNPMAQRGYVSNVSPLSPHHINLPAA